MRHLSILLSVFLTAVFAGLPVNSGHGAEDPPVKSTDKKGSDKKGAAKKGAGKADAPAKPALSDDEEWKRLMTRKQEIFKELEVLGPQFQVADEAGKKKLSGRVQQLQAEFQSELGPGIMKLAPKLFERDPTNPEVAEVMIPRSLEGREFQNIVKIVDKVFAAEKATVTLATYKGIALFNIGDFDGSKAAFEEASKLDKKAFAQFGAHHLDMTIKYGEFWKEELAIREKEEQADDLPRVLLKTNRGEIELELFENEAPNTVANFVSLVEAGKYDGTQFHRVIPGFMSQGGVPNSLDGNLANDGQGGPGYTIACECYSEKARKHFPGVLSMAHGGRDTGGSQFFLTHNLTPHLDYNPGKPKDNHTVFGRVIKGLEIATGLKVGDKIEKATVLRKRDHKYVPETLAEKRTRGAKSQGKPKAGKKVEEEE
jgi:cyclophilin family peptidyl-prolyl cis-trans isomerase